jgi:hypothetical protein
MSYYTWNYSDLKSFVDFGFIESQSQMGRDLQTIESCYTPSMLKTEVCNMDKKK